MTISHVRNKSRGRGIQHCDKAPESQEAYENKLGEGFSDEKSEAKHDNDNNITIMNESQNNLDSKSFGSIVGEEANGNLTLESPLPPPAPKDMGAIYLIIIMYYFQDAQLFHIKTASTTPESPTQAMIKALLLGLFKFRLEVAQFVNNVCLMPGLSASVKLLAKTLLVPYVLIIFAALYIFYMMITCIGLAKRPIEGNSNKTFLSRLCTGFMLALMFTYQRLATTTFKLLNCVPVGNRSVLFIDGSVNCYETWQYGVVVYALCCIVPFCGVLLLGPSLLKERRIALPTFFTACLMPLPFVIVWGIIRLSKSDCCLKPSDTEAPQMQVVLKILQGPFKDLSLKCVGPVCWAGVLIFRRLVLVLLFTFINHSLIRIIAMLLVCFIILLHHVHVQPYKDVTVNIAGSVSVSALMIVGGINLVRAGFEVAEYVPQGPNAALMWFMEWTEDVMMLYFPAAIMSLVAVALVTKIFFIIIYSCRH